jgi:hypothetical protein
MVRNNRRANRAHKNSAASSGRKKTNAASASSSNNASNNSANNNNEFVLTNWECQFASDVSQRYTHDYELSAKQLNVAQRIVAKVDAARERR